MPDSSNFDNLVGQDARLRKGSRMVPDGPLSAATRADIRALLVRHMEDGGLSQTDVAEAIGQSATYVNNLLTKAASLPEATAERMWRDVNNWLEREARARESQRPDDFVRTRVAERLIALAERLAERPDMAVAFGPAGIGKSTVIKAVVAEIPTAVAITAGHDTRTVRKFIDVVYFALTRRRQPGRKYVSLADLVDKLRMPPRVQTRSLLIIDQAHELPDKVWSVLMELHDRAECSILLVGTIDLKQRVATDDDPEFGQLSSRIGMRIQLAPELSGSLTSGRSSSKCFAVADIRKLFNRSKLKLHPDAAHMLCRIANTQRGTLRRVCRLFDWAETAARRKGAKAITVDHIRAAGSLVEEEFELPFDEQQQPGEAVREVVG